MAKFTPLTKASIKLSVLDLETAKLPALYTLSKAFLFKIASVLACLLLASIKNPFLNIISSAFISERFLGKFTKKNTILHHQVDILF